MLGPEATVMSFSEQGLGEGERGGGAELWWGPLPRSPA